MQRLAFFIALLCILAPWAIAQDGQFTGHVTDAQSAIVPNAEVRLVNSLTAVERRTKTNDAGIYALPFLEPGKYKVIVTAPGFSTAITDELTLTTGQTVVVNVKLQVGAISQEVKVTASNLQINSTDGSVSTVVDRNFVENLPLNGRSFQSLFELTPGTVIAKSSTNNAGQFNIDGQRSTSNYMMVDGVSANIAIGSGLSGAQTPAGVLPATSVLGGTNNLVSVDALQEFRIQTSSFAPEYGRTPGGQVQVVTRSGTNQFHGDVFEYFRNDKLDANNWFSNQNNIPKAKEHQNDFGGVFGGPILKDRTFVFLSYEGLRLIQPNTVAGLNVPTAAARAAAPASTRPYLDAFALPTGQDLGNGFGVLNTSYSNPSNLNAGSVRIDHRLSDRWTLFSRYNEAPSTTNLRVTTPSEIDVMNSRTRTITAGATGILSPTTTLDVRMNWSGIVGTSVSVLSDFGGATPPPASLLYPINGSAELSKFTFEVGTSIYTTGQNANNRQKQWNLATTLADVHGKHSLKYGMDLRWLTPSLEYASSPLILYFGGGIGLGVATPPAGTFLSGKATLAQVSTNGAGFPMHLNNYSFFAQDTWQVLPKLTLTFGLRWDIDPPISASSGRLAAVTGVQTPSTVALAPAGAPLWNIAYTNIAPRFGLAYSVSRNPGSETVIRAGFGVFHDLVDGGYLAQQSTSAPNSNVQTLTNVSVPLANLVAPPLPATPPFSTFFAIDPNISTPLIYEYNLGIERGLGSHVKASATYVGSSGHDLGRLETLTNPNATFASLYLQKSDANSNYNALQLQIQGRLGTHLQFLGNYVWSHSIDDASSDTATSVPLSTFVPASTYRASSDFDIRHSATFALSYEVPRPRGPWLMKSLFGGWGSDLTFRARSADPVSVSYSRNLGYGTFTYFPDIVPGVPVYLPAPNAGGGRRINPAAFQIPSTLREGDLSRNAFRGFDLAQADLAIRRQFSLSERIKLQFRAEFFNLTNHPNFADPSGSLGSATAAGTIVIPSSFGTSTSVQSTGLGGLSPIYQVGGPRSIQLALKVVF